METEQEIATERRRLRLLRRPRWVLVLFGFVLMLLLIAVVVWTQRQKLVNDILERELESRGVQASYQITRIGFRTERIANVVIGDPARPDLTAEWAEIKIKWTITGPKIGRIKARGVRMFARIVDGQLSFGQVDRLLPPKTGAPFRFPDQEVDVADAAIALDTQIGRMAIAIEGQGNLADGFRGEIAGRSSELLLGSCALDRPVLYAKVEMNDRRPNVDGPLSAVRLLCPDNGLDIVAPRLTVKATVPETMDSWIGEARGAIESAAMGGNVLDGVAAELSFSGNNDLTRGTIELGAAGAALGGFKAGRTGIEGRYAVAPRTGQVSLLADASVRGVQGGEGAIGPALSALSAADGTPLEPLAKGLSDAVRRAAGSLDALATIRLVNGRNYGAVRVDRLSANSRSGAQLGITGGNGLTYYWPQGQMRMDGEFALSGGGFPAARLSLSQPRAGGPVEGEARIAPYAAGNARLVLAPVRFRGAGGGMTRVETAAVLSGPFNDGYVRDLSLPILATFSNNGFSFGDRCITVGFRSLEAAGLTLEGTRLPLCPTDRALVWKQGSGPIQGGADVRDVRLAGRLGSNPIGLTSSRVRFAIAGQSFNAADLAVRLGAPGSVSRLDASQLNGRFNSQGVAGRFAGLDGQIANVPLLLSQGAGEWSVLGGRVAMGGSVTVSDAVAEPRFHPLVSNDFRLTLVDNQIEAGGLLEDPDNGTDVMVADIDHNLNTGAGGATLDIAGIRFDPEGYQPEDLTRLTTGVVALVDGTLSGQGRIDWSETATSSSGRFTVTEMDLAAPFGPVEGLTTTIEFTDLLGLTTAPGQLAQVDAIHTGIDVVDGTIRYQLLPDLRVRVESGIWPFMGGQLVLEETILDFSQPSTKRLVFRAIGLDAATFVQQMEFANIEISGTFDGILPMEFDENGGRIVGGRLEARPPGGTLSYIGELTDKELGTFGKMAFDALKSLRYDKLVINATGALDGEFLAGIELDGIARNTGAQGGIVGSVLNQLAKLRFEFNVNIRGPFRALIGTARSFSDPTDLIQPVLPTALQGKVTEVIREQKDEDSTTTGEPEPTPIPLIQPQESGQPQESEGEQ